MRESQRRKRKKKVSHRLSGRFSTPNHQYSQQGSIYCILEGEVVQKAHEKVLEPHQVKRFLFFFFVRAISGCPDHFSHFLVSSRKQGSFPPSPRGAPATENPYFCHKAVSYKGFFSIHQGFNKLSSSVDPPLGIFGNQKKRLILLMGGQQREKKSRF